MNTQRQTRPVFILCVSHRRKCLAPEKKTLRMNWKQQFFLWNICWINLRRRNKNGRYPSVVMFVNSFTIFLSPSPELVRLESQLNVRGYCLILNKKIQKYSKVTTIWTDKLESVTYTTTKGDVMRAMCKKKFFFLVPARLSQSNVIRARKWLVPHRPHNKHLCPSYTIPAITF